MHWLWFNVEYLAPVDMANDLDAQACDSSFAILAFAIKFFIRYMGSRRIVYDVNLITILFYTLK